MAVIENTRNLTFSPVSYAMLRVSKAQNWFERDGEPLEFKTHSSSQVLFCSTNREKKRKVEEKMKVYKCLMQIYCSEWLVEREDNFADASNNISKAPPGESQRALMKRDFELFFSGGFWANKRRQFEKNVFAFCGSNCVYVVKPSFNFVLVGLLFGLQSTSALSQQKLMKAGSGNYRICMNNDGNTREAKQCICEAILM